MRWGSVPRSWYRVWYGHVVRPFVWMEVTWFLRLHTVLAHVARVEKMSEKRCMMLMLFHCEYRCFFKTCSNFYVATSSKCTRLFSIFCIPWGYEPVPVPSSGLDFHPGGWAKIECSAGTHGRGFQCEWHLVCAIIRKWRSIIVNK